MREQQLGITLSMTSGAWHQPQVCSKPQL